MLLQRNFTRPGPGVDRDAPEKRGLARVIELLARHFWDMVKLNVIFLLCCLPVVTIGAAVQAMHTVLREMVQDEAGNWWATYRRTFRQAWRRGSALTLVTVFGLVISAVGSRFYYYLAADTPALYVAFMLCTTVLLLTLSVSVYLFGLPAAWTFRKTVRTALVLSLRFPLRTVAAVLCAYLLPLLAILALPFSAAYLLTAGFALAGLLTQFFIRIPLRVIPALTE